MDERYYQGGASLNFHHPSNLVKTEPEPPNTFEYKPQNAAHYSPIPVIPNHSNPAQSITDSMHTTSTPDFDRSSTYDVSSRLEEIRKMYYENPLASQLLEIETLLADALMKLDYGPKVSHAYNPVDYAYKPHMEYYRKFCQPSAEVVMVGMNPGPFGMSQTGVPFGEVNTVSQWMQICEPVGSPNKPNSKRPVQGFDCRRSEVSGKRIWTFLRENFETADLFFEKCFIYNYCPLSFMRESGKNFTPNELPAAPRRQLQRLCDEALLKSIRLFPNCHSLVGIGRFSEESIKRVCKEASLTHSQMYLLHPSPQNPHANKNWKSVAQRSFEELGLLSPSAGQVDASATSSDLSNTTVKRNLFKEECDEDTKE